MTKEGGERHMENGRKEFVSTLCNIYIVFLLAVLPLYTQGTYYKIGDSKYLLFRNVSLICLGIWMAYVIVSGVSAWIGRLRTVKRGGGKGPIVSGQTRSELLGRKAWSIVDIAVLAYGACVLLSALLSPYRTTAWFGYQDWYMGALSQLLFVGIYFFVSREYTRVAHPIRLGEAGLFLVVLIAFLQRFGLDILNLQAPFQTADWEYSHMLSTIGNINWLCGYLSVLLPWPVVGFFYSKRRGKQMIYYIISVLALVLTLTQGSDTGILLVIACLGLGILYGIRRTDFFRKSVLLALGVCVVTPLMGYAMALLKTSEMLAADGFVTGLITKPFWWAFALVLLLVYALQRILPTKKVQWLNHFLLIGGIIIAVGLIVIYLCNLPSGDEWGTGRLGLWQAAWMGFCRSGWLQKLIGVGPDCYAEYIYGMPALAELIQMEGHWGDSIFANAHNEWLNTLVNCGLLGLGAYAGVFVCALRRYRGMMLGVMVLVLYGVNSLFSFQQVLNAPLLFLVLGICESRYRAEFVKHELQEIA